MDVAVFNVPARSVFALVRQLPPERTETHVADDPRQLAVSHHALDAKVLDDDAAVSLHTARRHVSRCSRGSSPDRYQT